MHKLQRRGPQRPLMAVMAPASCSVAARRLSRRIRTIWLRHLMPSDRQCRRRRTFPWRLSWTSFTAQTATACLACGCRPPVCCGRCWQTAMAWRWIECHQRYMKPSLRGELTIQQSQSTRERRRTKHSSWRAVPQCSQVTLARQPRLRGRRRCRCRRRAAKNRVTTCSRRRATGTWQRSGGIQTTPQQIPLNVAANLHAAARMAPEGYTWSTGVSHGDPSGDTADSTHLKQCRGDQRIFPG